MMHRSLVAWCGLAAAGLVFCGCQSGSTPTVSEGAPAAVSDSPPPDPAPAPVYIARPKGSLTFSKDVAPIVFHKCAVCHHAGEVAPFALVSYEDVRKRARQIVEVTKSRFMPPFSPVPGYCDFQRDRSLSVNEIGMIAQWVDEGAVRGDTQPPAVPSFPNGWRSGTPDLVIQLDQAYELPADAKNVFRKFVLRVPVTERKHVRAVEFDPGARKVVHHARIRVDPTSWSRYLDERDPQPGFEGTMTSGDLDPPGVMLGWTPGYVSPLNNGLTWTLEKRTDLVVEMHMFGSGKPELVKPSVALYFTPQAPQSHPGIVKLSHDVIDIPAGQKDYLLEDQFVLPVDTEAVSVYPHAHFLCRDIQTYAVLPDGAKKWLLRIADWDFNWQDSYSYAKPVVLPKGTRLFMRLTYDNSAANPRNPFNPPREIHFGRNTDDEMGDVAFQMLCRSAADAQTLAREVGMKEYQNDVASALEKLRWKPDDWEAHYNLALLYDQADEISHALEQYEQAVRLHPEGTWARNNLGTLYLNLGRLDDAASQFNQVLKIEPANSKSHNNLGLVFLQQRKFAAAAVQFEAALRSNPEFPEARANLGRVALAEGKPAEAAKHFEAALKIDANCQPARAGLEGLRQRSRTLPNAQP